MAGVQLVITDAHEGLREAIAAVLVRSSWQRCGVDFLRNVLARVPRGSAEMVAAAVFAQPDGAAVREQLGVIADKLGRQFPAVAAMLGKAAEALTAFTAFTAFPAAPWRKIWSTNP